MTRVHPYHVLIANRYIYSHYFLNNRIKAVLAVQLFHPDYTVH